jgi:tellurite resistance protein TehA-like permease
MKLRVERGPRDNLETLHPAYFALIMATGIVALATHLHGIYALPSVLFWLNAFFFISLIVVMSMRIARYPQAFAADLRSHSRGVGFFTVIAAFGVFGSQLVLQMEAVSFAIFCWVIAAALWIIVTYGVLTMLIVEVNKPSLAEGINGGWLVIVVATQSVSILTVLILPSFASADTQGALMFTALTLWLSGGGLYLWLTTLILLRCTFSPMSAQDVTPLYWINMGSAAISTAAGATLVAQSALSPLATELMPFVKGLTLLFWSLGSWWIPMLIALGIWRYLICGVPFAYGPLYWGGVFPLGMYSASTYWLAKILSASYLMPVSYAFMIVAIIAWMATFVGLLDSALNWERPH